jgi:hypothetical protein
LAQPHENLSRYADRHGVSRQTLYSLHSKFLTSCSPQKSGPKPTLLHSTLFPPPPPQPSLPPFHYLLGNLTKSLSSQQQHQLHRTILEASVSPVSTKKIQSILRQAFLLQLSKRKIKALLNAYSQKAHSLLKNLHLENYVHHVALDEIFCGKMPILVGVELDSFAVVLLEKSLKRDYSTWLTALKPFEFLELVVSDEGSGLIKAIEEKGVPHQLDLFHFKREASKILRHLESEAYKKIEQEYLVEKKVLKNWWDLELKVKGEREKGETLKTIELFDKVEKAVKEIEESLELFDKEGNIREPSENLEKIKKAGEELREASANKRIQNLAKKVSEEKLLHYMKKWKEKWEAIKLEWKAGVGALSKKEVFQLIGDFLREKEKKVKVFEKAGEERKERMLRRKEMEKKHYKKRLLNSLKVNELKGKLENFEEVVKEVEEGLSEVYRASSLVESYNSQIRIGQQVKKGVTKEYLWLSALKWNVTPFEGGKRKGKSPVELLGVKTESSDWLDLLMKTA